MPGRAKTPPIPDTPATGLLLVPPPPPKDLDAVGRETWLVAAKFLCQRHVLCSPDLVSLVNYCRAASCAQQLDAHIRASGVVINGKVNPLIAAYNTTCKSLREIAFSLGLTPNSRMALPANARDATKDDSVLEASPIGAMLVAIEGRRKKPAA